jgi:hypothetical protein
MVGGLVVSALLASVLGVDPPAGVAESAARPWLLTIDPGLYIANEHLSEFGPGVSVPPPAYLGLTFERTITGPLDVNVSAGAAASLGWMLAATVRFAGPPPSRIMRVSVGVGPGVITGAQFGSSAFAQGDVAIEVRFPRGPALVFGPRVAVAVTSAGTQGCGVDTCSAYVRPGDVVFTLRSGAGFTF